MRFGARVGCGARDGAGFRAGPGPGGLPRRGRGAGWALGRRFQPSNRSPTNLRDPVRSALRPIRGQVAPANRSPRQGEAAQCGLWKGGDAKTGRRLRPCVDCNDWAAAGVLSLSFKPPAFGAGMQALGNYDDTALFPIVCHHW